MFDYQGCKCPVCQQPFAESDDIVAFGKGLLAHRAFAALVIKHMLAPPI